MLEKIALDKVGPACVALSIPSAIVGYLMKISGFKGSAAFNSSLKLIGRDNMYRGAFALLLMTIATDKFLETTSEKVAIAFIRSRIKDGEKNEVLLDSIEKMPLSEGTKAKLILEVYEREEEISE